VCVRASSAQEERAQRPSPRWKSEARHERGNELLMTISKSTQGKSQAFSGDAAKGEGGRSARLGASESESEQAGNGLRPGFSSKPSVRPQRLEVVLQLVGDRGADESTVMKQGKCYFAKRRNTHSVHLVDGPPSHTSTRSDLGRSPSSRAYSAAGLGARHEPP